MFWRKPKSSGSLEEAKGMMKEYWSVDARQKNVEKIGIRFIGYISDLDCAGLKDAIDYAKRGNLMVRGDWTVNAYFLNILTTTYRNRGCEEGR